MRNDWFCFIDCPVLRSGEGALASNRDTAFGTVVTYSCAVGQEFATGKSKLVTECQMGGNWSVTYIPKCQGIVFKFLFLFSLASFSLTYENDVL